MDYFIEEKRKIKGIIYPFHCHEQVENKKKVIVNAHIHDEIEILYCIVGKVEVFLNNKRLVLNKGDLIIINAREIHKITALTNELVRYIVVKFEPEVLYTTSQTIFEAKYVFPFTLSTATHQKLFAKDEIENTFVPSLMKEIFVEFENKKYGFELAIRSNICRLFLWILRHWDEQGINLNLENFVTEDEVKRLQIAFEYVDENYQNNITMEDVAQICNVSYSYFSRFFKSVMKRNFSEYLNSVRIMAAEKLLTSTQLNITEIAYEVGYSTTSYFIHQFKLYKNVSPMQYRKQWMMTESEKK